MVFLKVFGFIFLIMIELVRFFFILELNMELKYDDIVVRIVLWYRKVLFWIWIVMLEWFLFS